MKIFITGINGFIGSNLASYLSSINHNIYGSVSEDWKLYNKHKLVKKLFVIKLNKPFDETIFNEMDVIIHCAYDHSKHSTATNINGTISISKAANSNKTKQIFVSSYSAHNNNETDYGKVKYSLEDYFLKKGHIIIRPGLVVGSGGLFVRIYKIMQKYPIVPLLDGGKGLVPILCIKDLEVCISKIINKYNAGTFNLFNKKYITLHKFAHELRDKAKFNILFISIPSKIIFLITMILDVIGIKMPISRDSIKSFNQNQDLMLESDLNNFIEKEYNLSEMIRLALVE